MRRSTPSTLSLALAALLLAAPLARAARLGAALDPSSIAQDQAATLRLPEDTPAPAVDGLRFRPTGSSTEVESVNGKLTTHSWRLYQVTAEHAGSFVIPAGGQQLKLVVSPAGAARARAPAARAGADDAAGVPAFLRVTLPKRRIYVGEAVPVTFRAYFRAGTEATLAGPPALGSTSFTVGQLADQPRQTIETVGGVPYRVASWTAQLEAATAGTFEAGATLPVSLRWREQPTRAVDPFRSFFDDDDFPPADLRAWMNGLGDPFGAVHERELTLHTPVQPIEVLPLPERGRPADFSGAVGQFEVRTTVPPAATALEPTTLTIAISGHGSFDRVTTAGLPSSPALKSYPPAAKTGNTPGTRTFEQPIVPERSGEQTIPAVAFSYFDPRTERYQTARSQPLPLHVAAAPATSASAAAPPTTASSDGWRPDRPLAAPAPAHRPVYRRPWFWLLEAVPLAALLVLWRRRSTRSSRRAQRRALAREIGAWRADMHRAAAAADSPRFFAASRAAVQLELGARWQIPPGEVSAELVRQRLGPDGEPLARALTLAEEVQYGGRVPDGRSLAEWDAAIAQKLEVRP